MNCWVVPTRTLALTGEMLVGALLMTVTTALAGPPGPLAVTVSKPEEGHVLGAVYRPVLLTVP